MPSYNDQIAEALDRALEEARRGQIRRFDATKQRMIILSDLHRGAQDRADDHRKSVRAFGAAMAYYYELGYHLVMLGDCEELWEERPKTVLRKYAYTLGLEAPFNKAERYMRVWGNHDDYWESERAVRRHLVPILGEITVHSALLYDLYDGEDRLGRMFMVHGHQGTAGSDRFGWLSRLVVRYAWRPFQRVTGRTLNTPATNWDLRYPHNKAMHAWATSQPGMILIAGHTHRPVHMGKDHLYITQLEIKKVRQETPLDIDRLALLKAKAEWIKAQSLEAPSQERPEYKPTPTYFNTGGCCYPDGDITGIDISAGSISLIRWPSPDGEPAPHVLETAKLKKVFASAS